MSSILLCHSYFIVITYLLPSQVNTHGQLSFGTPFIDFEPEPFPLGAGVILIAPFWDDIDTTGPTNSTGGAGGQLFFRHSGDENLLSQIGNIVGDAFMTRFSPSLIFIATWEQVPETMSANGVS